jgi:hypothetical protein
MKWGVETETKASGKKSKPVPPQENCNEKL